MSKRILVTGATGTVASSTIPQLLEAKAEVRAMVHSPEKAAPLEAAGVEVVVGDFDSGQGLDEAFRGVEAAFLIAPGGPTAADRMHRLIEAAKAAEVGHVLRLSALKASPDAPTDNGRQHYRSDTELERSGSPFTILRPHYYMQNLLWSVPTIRDEGKLYTGMGDGRLGMVDTRDVADCAARILLDGGHEGKTYTPTGPASVGFRDVANAIAKVAGKPVEYVPLPPETVGENMRPMGEWAAQVMTDYSTAYGRGWGDFTTKDVETITGHPARSIDRFAAEVLGPAFR